MPAVVTGICICHFALSQILNESTKISKTKKANSRSQSQLQVGKCNFSEIPTGVICNFWVGGAEKISALICTISEWGRKSTPGTRPYRWAPLSMCIPITTNVFCFPLVAWFSYTACLSTVPWVLWVL